MVGSYVYNSGNLVLDLLYNLMLESTGRLQKCRIYEMTDNKTARSTIAYLIVRDQAHENAFAKALESLGVNWGKCCRSRRPTPSGSRRSRGCSTWACRACSTPSAPTTSARPASSSAGASPSKDGTELSTEIARGVPDDISPERPEEFSPGLDKDLLALIQATAEVELKDADDPLVAAKKK